MFALELPYWQLTIIKTVIVLMIIPGAAVILGYVFLLKMMAHMQSRMGPMEPGGYHGWFQLIGDGIKFIQKEDIIPDQADRRVFALAPLVVLISTFLLYVVLPAGPSSASPGSATPSSSPRSSASASSWPRPRPSSPRPRSTCPSPSRSSSPAS